MRERLEAKSLEEVRAAYDAVYARSEYGDKAALYHKLLKLLGPELPASGAPVLDVACGAGQWLAFLAARGIPGLGCELSSEALARARARAPQAGLCLADGGRLPYADGRFRWLSCLGSLEHFLEPSAGAAELARVLAPRGRAAIMLPNAYYSGDIWRVIWRGYGPNHHQVIDRFATHHEWRDLLEDSGLKVLRSARYDKGKLLKRLFPFHLAYHFIYICARR